MVERVMHTLVIETTFDDGTTSRWSYDQPGDARSTHVALAMRWRAAKKTFTRDDKALTLIRRYDDPEIGGYVDVIKHVSWEDA